MLPDVRIPIIILWCLYQLYSAAINTGHLRTSTVTVFSFRVPGAAHVAHSVQNTTSMPILQFKVCHIELRSYSGNQTKGRYSIAFKNEFHFKCIAKEQYVRQFYCIVLTRNTYARDGKFSSALMKLFCKVHLQRQYIEKVFLFSLKSNSGPLSLRLFTLPLCHEILASNLGQSI